MAQQTNTEIAKFALEVYRGAHERLTDRLEGDRALATVLMAGIGASDFADKIQQFLENRSISLPPEQVDKIQFLFSEAKAMHTLKRKRPKMSAAAKD